MSNILILAPHPDDEVLGCGGTIKKLVNEGSKIFVAVMTNANVGAPHIFSEEAVKEARAEALEAHSKLGVTKTFFFDLPAPTLINHPQFEVVDPIVGLIRQLDISDLYLPHRGDIHLDHVAVFNAGLVAARPRNNNPVKNVYAYETLSETEWAAPYSNDAFIPNCFVDISETFEDKISAMQCFKSQVMEFPNSRSIEAIEALAKFRGATVTCKAAEAFMVIRICY